MKKKKVLIVGGAGYIGSHVNKMLNRADFETVVLDNLSQGNRKTVKQGTFIEGDISDEILLNRLFKEHQIDAVMHFAALIDVGESVSNPSKYYKNNLSNTLCLLDAMRRHHVNIFIFSSTAAIFGSPQQSFINEDHPCHPINPYGRSKLMVEWVLRDLDHAYGLRYSALRYFNAAGGDPEQEIKYYKKDSSNLIPKILKTLLQGTGKVTIFGTDYPTPDGTCIRDYIHIDDLGQAHILALKKLFEGAPSAVYNLGNGQGFSVREVITAVEKVTGRKVPVIEGPRRPGDPTVLVADAVKAERELGWECRYPALETMIEHAWRAMQ